MPDWKSYLSEHLALPALRRDLDARALRELADHLEDLYAEARGRGASAEEAEAQAIASLGNAHEAAAELIAAEPGHLRAGAGRWAEGRQEELRRRGGVWSRLADGVHELGLALRALAKHPLFAGVSVFVLALGIAAFITVFTLVDAIVISPLPFEASDRLVTMGHLAPNYGMTDLGHCAAMHLTYADHNRVFEEVGLFQDRQVAVTGEGAPETVTAVDLTSGVFRALRIGSSLGRTFTPEDEVSGAPTALLLSHRYWQSRFGGDPAVLGRTLRVNEVDWEIVGVMPAAARSLGPDPALYLPLRFQRSDVAIGNWGPGGIGRLRTGVSLEEATADLARMWPLALEEFSGGPVGASEAKTPMVPRLQLLKDDLVGPTAELLWILLGGVAVVLLVAGANVGNLFLVRAEGREGEMAVRTTMGADSSRIAWEFLKESFLLGALGGVLGLTLAAGALRLLVATGPARLPRLEEVALGPQALLLAIALSVGAGIFLGLLALLRHGRAGLTETLRQGGAGGVGGRLGRRAQGSLAVCQIALALPLLVAAGLMLRTFDALRDVEPGFGNPEEVLTFRITIPFAEMSDLAEVARAHELIFHRLEEIPGVTSVGLANSVPMDNASNHNPLYVEGQLPPPGEPPEQHRHKWIGQDYFETLQIPLLAGRAFTWHEVHNRIPSALVSASLARKYWGSVEAALGRRVSVRPEPLFWYEVIGVVGDAREDGVDQEGLPTVYWPQVTMAFWQGSPADEAFTWSSMAYAIRTPRVGSASLLGDVREAIWSVNPNLPLERILPLSELLARSMARSTFTLVLLGIASGVVFILGIVGVYGVLSYAVSQRRREMGVRMALGAAEEQVKGMVLRQGLALALTGVAVGLTLAVGLTRLMAGLLYGVRPLDPVSYGMVTVGLLVVAVGASYLPARRAARVDPIVALRAE